MSKKKLIGIWRLPTAKELLTLVDSTFNPASTHVPEMKLDYYWSSDEVVPGASVALGIDFSVGHDDWNNKTNTFYVRCVRDTEGGLEWAVETTPIGMTWDDAMKYAESLNNKNWRLPTVKELETLLCKTNIEIKNGFYWSGTHDSITSYAWAVNVQDGGTSYNFKTNTYRVRCVKDTRNGLEWSETAPIRMSWSEAVAYAWHLNKETT